jgi:hypothetical protein
MNGQKVVSRLANFFSFAAAIDISWYLTLEITVERGKESEKRKIVRMLAAKGPELRQLSNDCARPVPFWQATRGGTTRPKGCGEAISALGNGDWNLDKASWTSRGAAPGSLLKGDTQFVCRFLGLGTEATGRIRS